MDLSLQVAPSLKRLRTKSVSDALGFSEALVVTPVERTLGQLSVDSVTVMTDTFKHEFQESRLTRHAVMGLCRILGIPDPFARKIPNDLLLTNIRRLMGTQLDTKVVALLRPDKSIAGFVKKKYSEVSYADVLGAIESKKGIEYIDIGEDMLTVCLKHEEMQLPDPIETTGTHSLYVGSFLFSSILAVKPLHVRVGLYRTACENSFVGVYLGKLKADYKLNTDVRMLRFAEHVGTFDDDVLRRFKQSIEHLQNHTLYTHELAHLWSRYRSVVGAIDADKIIDYTEDSRKQLTHSVSTWKSTNKRARLVGDSILDPIPSDRRLFDVVNRATTLAKDFTGVERFQVEELSGKLLEKYILN